MGKILLLLLIAFLVYLVFRGFFRGQTRDKAPPPAPGEAEDMVACARCGVNVPRSETREVGGRRVCAANPQCR